MTDWAEQKEQERAWLEMAEIAIGKVVDLQCADNLRAWQRFLKAIGRDGGHSTK